MDDPHNLLGVDRGASQAEIKRAFRRKALECHPDVVATAPPAVQAAKAKEYASVVEAYERLSSRVGGTRGASTASAGTQQYQQYQHASSSYYRADGGSRHRGRGAASAKQSVTSFARNAYTNGGLILLTGVFCVGLAVFEPMIEGWWEASNKEKLFKHIADVPNKRSNNNSNKRTDLQTEPIL
jgi:curved DNA-binding protein CbpA